MSGSGGNSNAINRISGFDLPLLRVARSEEIVDRVFFFSQLVSGSSEQPEGDTDSDLISIHLDVRRECADSVDVQVNRRSREERHWAGLLLPCHDILVPKSLDRKSVV